MSTPTAGASQSPNQGPSGSGPFKNASNGSDITQWPRDNKHNQWEKNTKIKTCKCRICDERVHAYSYKCTKCHNHVCSECIEPQGASYWKHKWLAQDRLNQKCHCYYPSGLPPYALRVLEGLEPPKQRFQEDQKAKEQKRLISDNKAAADASKANQPDAHDHVTTKTAKRSKPQGPPMNKNSSTPGSAGDKLQERRNAANAGLESTAWTMFREQRLKRKARETPNYLESETSESTVSDFLFDRPLAKKVKATSTANASAISDPFVSNSKATSVLQEPGVIAHLQGGHTVVIGAGCVGMFLARELALKARETRTEHAVTIVEARSSYCELASGHCAGFLTSRNLPDGCQALENPALQSWEDLASIEGFADAIDLDYDSLSVVVDVAGLSMRESPSWARRRSDISCVKDQKAFGRISSTKLASWLYEQCIGLGVTFRFDHTLRITRFDPEHDITSIDVESIATTYAVPELIPCTNLVVAAGPFSSGVFEKIFGTRSTPLPSHVQSCDWFRAHLPKATGEGDEIGLILPHAAVAEEKLENHVTIVAHPSTKSLVASCIRTKGTHRPMQLHDALQKVGGQSKEIRPLLSKYLSIEGLDLTHDNYSEHVVDGRCYIGTAINGRPVIDKVPFSGLGRRWSIGDDGRACGVWLCYGFGNNGTFLAPAAARLVVSKMCGEVVNADGYHLERK